jgi:hypothetical protein
MPRVICRLCGTPLTLHCAWGLPEQHDLAVGCGKSPVPEGMLIRLAEDSGGIYLSEPGVEGERRIGTHVHSPEGAIAANPQSVLPGALLSSGDDIGCCGSSGMDGPNRSCRCGNVVATEWSDCWTLAEVRFLPDAVTSQD